MPRLPSRSVLLPPRREDGYDRKIRQLSKNGKLTVSLREAGGRIGLTQQAVQKRCAKLGIETKHSALWKSHVQRDTWSPAATAELLAMCRDGVLTVEIEDAAKAFKCHPATVKRKLDLCGMQVPTHRFHWTPEKRALLESMCLNGFLQVKLAVAARRIGCSERAVSEAAAALQVKTTGKQVFYGDKKKQLRKALRRGVPVERLALAHNCSVNTVRRAKARLAASKRKPSGARLKIQLLNAGAAIDS